jgi:putative DNA primase/helicase
MDISKFLASTTATAPSSCVHDAEMLSVVSGKDLYLDDTIPDDFEISNSILPPGQKLEEEKKEKLPPITFNFPPVDSTVVKAILPPGYEPEALPEAVKLPPVEPGPVKLPPVQTPPPKIIYPPGYVPKPPKADGFKAQTAAVPQIMKDLPTWLCRTAEKHPINPQHGYGASVTDASTWGTYDEACTYADGHPDKVTGISFAFTVDSGIVGVDLDHCLGPDHKFLDARFQKIYEMAKSYAEISPSGDGLHFYVKGEWPKGIGNKKNLEHDMKIEVYCQERHYSVTGNRFGEATDIVENQAVLDYIKDTYFPVKKNQCRQTHVADGLDGLNVDDNIKDRLIEALDHNSYFASLWEGDRPKQDESSDDQALLCRLVVVAEGNEDIINSLFMASPHVLSKDSKHLDKLEREDYLSSSIANAIKWVSENPDFAKNDNDIQLLDFADNDAGNADKFLYAYGDIVKYCSDYDSWYVYDGKRWREDGSRYEINRRGVELYQRAMRIFKWLDKDDEQIQNRKKRFSQLGNCCTRGNLIKTAELKSSIPSETFNKYNNLLVAANGIVNLKTGALLPYDSEKYITLMTQLNYNPEAQPPTRFLQFLTEIFDGDAELISYVHRLLGYCLTGETNVQSFFIMYGAGSNGKSVLLNLMQRMFPEHVKTVAPGAFLKKKDVNCPNSTLVNAKDARMVLVSETAKGSELDEILLKRSSGQDTVTARKMYKAEIEFKPHFKTVFSTNHIPNIDWSDRAMVRRNKIIPFTHVFSGKDVDYGLSAKLWAEREGIFTWLVQGAVEYYKNNMSLGELPTSVNATVEAQRIVSDSFYGFFQEMVEITNSKEDRIQAETLYNSYINWCSDNDLEDENIVSKPVFANRLKERGINKEVHGHNRCRYYMGVKYKIQDSVTVAPGYEN